MLGGGQTTQIQDSLLSTSFDERLASERAHGARIVEHASAIWGWDSPTGRRRLHRRAEMMRAQAEGKKCVIEYGAGTGEFTRKISPAMSRPMMERGPLQGALSIPANAAQQYIAFDISHDLLLAGRTQGAFEGAWLVEGDAHRMPFRNGAFDLISGSSILHHLDVEKALAEGYRVLASGGGVAFSEPNMANPQIAVVKRSRYLKAKVGDTPHETAYYKGEITGILRRAGFRSIRVDYYDFLYPLIPASLVSVAEKIGQAIERIPFLRAIAGSLWITAVK